MYEKLPYQILIVLTILSIAIIISFSISNMSNISYEGEIQDKFILSHLGTPTYYFIINLEDYEINCSTYYQYEIGDFYTQE